MCKTLITNSGYFQPQEHKMLTGQLKSKGTCSHGPQPDTSIGQQTQELKKLRNVSNLYAGQ